MKPTELKALILSRFKAGIKRPLHVESSPGLGKTQIAAQAAKELGVSFMAIHAPLLQPEDYGFPVIAADRSDVSFIVSKAKFPIEGSTCADTGIFLIDELSQADHPSQKILANLIHEREIHGQRIKPGWMFITTGNGAGDRAGATRLLTHLRDRLTPVPLEASLEDWTAWAIANAVKTEVIAFIRFRPELLSSFDPHQDSSPTPRSWVDGVSAALGVIDPSLELPVFKGDVGEGAAAEFCAFLKVFRKLPSPDAILVNPTGADVPSDPATLYALCGALAARTKADNFGRVIQYVKRMPAEFGVLYVRDAIRRCPAVQTGIDFIQWASTDGANILS